MNNRYGKGSGAGYTAGVERPSKPRAVSVRGVVGIVLTLLMPPVGLLFLWTQGVFRTRGRMLLTVLSTLEMMALFVWLTPHQELSPRVPVPAAPVSVTAAPQTDTLNALYNIEQLLYEQQLADVLAAGGTERDLLTEEEKLQEASAETEAIYNTVVYSVYSNAKFYHSSKVCGHQTNGRELTVRKALQEGLDPCPDCNPPVPDGM